MESQGSFAGGIFFMWTAALGNFFFFFLISQIRENIDAL
jgi:hypothetical protein